MLVHNKSFLHVFSGLVLYCEPACVGEEQLWAGEAKRHPEKASEAAGTVNVQTTELLLGVGVAVETHSAKNTRQTKQVISMQVGDENLGYAT